MRQFLIKHRGRLVAAAISAALFVIWHPPARLGYDTEICMGAITHNQFGGYFGYGSCTTILSADIMPTLWWVMVGGAIGAGLVYVAERVIASSH
jgi:hypothetical protein